MTKEELPTIKLAPTRLTEEEPAPPPPPAVVFPPLPPKPEFRLIAHLRRIRNSQDTIAKGYQASKGGAYARLVAEEVKLVDLLFELYEDTIEGVMENVKTDSGRAVEVYWNNPATFLDELEKALRESGIGEEEEEEE